MLLVLRLPEEWQERALLGTRAVVTLPGRAALEIEPLFPAPDEPKVFMAQAMLRDAPAGATLRDVMPVLARNELGWPMEVTAATLVDAGGNVLEARMGAFYKFQEWGGHALARGETTAVLDEVREQLIAAFASGRPDWRNPEVVAALAELWE
jgi:hypothetical protein